MIIPATLVGAILGDRQGPVACAKPSAPLPRIRLEGFHRSERQHSPWPRKLSHRQTPSSGRSCSAKNDCRRILSGPPHGVLGGFVFIAASRRTETITSDGPETLMNVGEPERWMPTAIVVGVSMAGRVFRRRVGLSRMRQLWRRQSRWRR